MNCKAEFTCIDREDETCEYYVEGEKYRCKNSYGDSCNSERAITKAVQDVLLNMDSLLHNSSRDWTKDFSNENGNYINICINCDSSFIGYKRETVCKVCSTSLIGGINQAENERDHLLKEIDQFEHETFTAEERVLIEGLVNTELWRCENSIFSRSSGGIKPILKSILEKVK